jgi:F0F1-type ATP synthase delta subunit
MFLPERWAAAFMELCGEKDLDEGISAFNTFVACTARLRNYPRGSNAARRFEALLRKALKDAGFNSADLSGKIDLSRDSPLENRGTELALRFIVFLIKKDYFRYRRFLLAEIEKAVDWTKGIAHVTLESAAPVDDELEGRIKTALMRRTGAGDIVIDRRIVPELIAGYRVYIGTDLLDTSFQGLLRKMAKGLGVPVNGKITGDPVDSVWEIV